MIKYVIRVSSEMGVKSPAVRKRWTTFLAQNIRKLARQVAPKAKVRQQWDGLALVLRDYSPEEESMFCEKFVSLLSATPGIAHFSKAKEARFNSAEELVELCIDHYQPRVEPDLSFAVRVRRKGNHNFKSPSIEAAVGAGLLKFHEALKVSLKAPDQLIQIDAEDSQVDLLEQRHTGLGGFPIGTQGSALVLLSGGFDSTLAAYLAIKRGIKVNYCYFDMGTVEQSHIVKSIAHQLWSRFGASHPARFIQVPWQNSMAHISENSGPGTAGVVLKRRMLESAATIAKKSKSECLITGEAVSQVASQTLSNLRLIDKVTTLPIMRPLVFTDKHDIISSVRRIGLESLCAGIKEVCGAVSVRPSAQVDPELLTRDELRLDPTIFDGALDNASVYTIDKLLGSATVNSYRGANAHSDTNGHSDVAQAASRSKSGPVDVIIDIRHPEDVARKPLVLPQQLAQVEIQTIPFYSLLQSLTNLARDKHYALYCREGSLSTIQAGYLREEGLEKVSVLALD